nr:MAG TPA: hypothetical protein [Caudoviricetes sp.]
MRITQFCYKFIYITQTVGLRIFPKSFLCFLVEICK